MQGINEVNNNYITNKVFLPNPITRPEFSVRRIINGARITGPILFYNIVHSNWYVKHILEPLSPGFGFDTLLKPQMLGKSSVQ
jgi:hypothetical protein